MWRALSPATVVVSLVLIGSAAYAQRTNQPSPVVNAKSYSFCTIDSLPPPPPPPQPLPKEWTVGDAITGSVTPSGVVLAVTLDPEDPDSATFAAVASDMDHWVKLDSITHEVREQGDEPDQMKATVDWGCEGGHFAPPADGYSATWVTPDTGDFYRVWAGVNDVPLEPGPGETGSRDDDARALQPDVPPAAVEATNLAAATSGEFHGHFPPFDVPDIAWGEEYWSQYSDRDLGVTTPSSPRTYDVLGFLKRTEIRATIVPHLAEYPYPFGWVQEVGGAMYIDGGLEDKGPYGGAWVKQKWTADPGAPELDDCSPDGSDEIQTLDTPGWPVPGVPEAWSTGYDDDLDHTLHMVGLLPDFGGVCEFRDKVTFHGHRISANWSDTALWTREVRLYANNTTGRKWVPAANN